MSQAVSAPESDRLPQVTTELLGPDGSSALRPVRLEDVCDTPEVLVTGADAATAYQAGTAPVEPGPFASAKIDLLVPDEWRVLSATRLTALRESPEAFVATLDTEARRAPAEWIANIESSTWVVARAGGEVVGVARLSVPTVSAQTDRFIESVWVTPVHRRKGLVRKMLWRLEEEARAAGARYLKLWVLETNDSAYDAYLKLDFHFPMPEVEQDSWKPWGDGTFVQERLMVKPLY